MGRPPKFEERSEEIMQAFETCVLRKGLPATTLADVAEESRLPRSLVRYFMGNRDDMVDRLIERLMRLAQTRLDAVRDEAGTTSVSRLLDAIFGEIFADDRSNALMGELWYLSRTDPHIGERLNEVYAYAISLLTDALGREHPEAALDARHAAAFGVLSLALGQTALNDFGLALPQGRSLRDQAAAIIVRFETETQTC
jgi:AcrR family transcriptional regulator